MLDSATERTMQFLYEHKSVDYDLEIRGAICPVCERKKAKTIMTDKKLPGSVVRYHKCQNCGYNFKSIEAAK